MDLKALERALLTAASEQDRRHHQEMRTKTRANIAKRVGILDDKKRSKLQGLVRPSASSSTRDKGSRPGEEQQGEEQVKSKPPKKRGKGPEEPAGRPRRGRGRGRRGGGRKANRGPSPSPNRTTGGRSTIGPPHGTGPPPRSGGAPELPCRARRGQGAPKSPSLSRAKHHPRAPPGPGRWWCQRREQGSLR